MSSCAKKMNNANEVVKTHEVDSEICVDEETIYSERTPRKPSLMFAMSLSDSLQRPILINFHADWCIPCRNMEAQVLSTESTALLLDKFIYWSIDGETAQGANIRTIYDVFSYPCFLIINSKGEVVQRKDGTSSEAEFHVFLNSVLN
jgi:thiol:disulfide interchange protein